MKIAATTKSCGECMHKRYYSGNRYECALVSQVILDMTQVAPFCPLADYPAGTIAGMEHTIAGLREPYKYGIHLALLNHVATKLKLNLCPDGGALDIRCMDGNEEHTVRFDVRNITEFDFQASKISFMDGGKTYHISPDANPPQLDLAVDHLGQNLTRRIHIR